MHSIIKAAQVKLEGHDVNNFTDSGSIGTAPKRALQKSARLVHVDGVARAVEVSCSCGDVHLIELDFEEN